MADTRFVSNPVNLDIQRSKFDRSFGHKTSFNAGQLVPVFVDEVLPGDTFDVRTACIVRMGTPIAPVMDNAYLDITYFFVPNRLVWEHWEQFNGQNDTTFWTQTIDYNVPQAVKDVAIARTFDDLAAYMGIPAAYTGADSSGVPCSVLPLRAYVLIWNEWYRDQNTQAPILVSKGDTDINKLLSFSLLQSNKYHDYFTSCLPAPQKGPSVLLPLGDLAPVMTGADHLSVVEANALPAMALGVGDAVSGSGSFVLMTNTDSSGRGVMSVDENTENISSPIHSPLNLWADLSEATSATINQLRLAFQIQKLLERDARGGTRYVEMLKAHFGVTSPDSRLQRPEYLGGQRINVAMDQVLSTTAPQTEDAEATIGTTGAYSRTGASGKGFVKSFVEHGYVIGLATIRTDQTYSQGLARFWTRSARFDFYYPVLANIGEQPVNKSEIYLMNDDPVVNNQVFGYQEAWADYRFKPSYCTGYMNPNVTGGLNYWTYGLSLSSAPVLNDDFMKQTGDEVSRTLAAGSTTHQFIADFWFTFYAKRPMPVYSVPGLIDHH